MRAIPVEALGVTKRFGAFAALDNVSLAVQPGTVHALLGENGAGKSTLVKCLLGYHRADAGTFRVDGKEVAIERPADAAKLGLGMVYQHFTLVPSMTAAENLVMSRDAVPAVIDWAAEREALSAFMARMPFKVPLDVPVGRLAAGERQKTEILKQLYLERRFLVLDEPTSVLTPQEAEEMLGLVRGLARAGELTIVIITHKLKEVTAFADEVTVLRRGRPAGGGSAQGLTAAEMIAMMVGEAQVPSSGERAGEPTVPPRLVLKGLATLGDGGRPGLSVGRLVVHGREIVGVAGVSGNGQRDLVEVLGGQRRASDGDLLIAGERYDATRAEAQSRRVRVLPEEPLKNGCVPSMAVEDNLSLRAYDRGPDGERRRWLDRKAMSARAEAMMSTFAIRTPSKEAPIRTLSGGNVQRCILARELDGKVDVLVAANPCFGLDVKAARETRNRIMAARNDGAAVLLVSEDLDEILELADRVVVMREGRIVHEQPAAGADVRTIGGHMAGHH